MKAIFNGDFLDSAEVKLHFEDRGFRYGDGLFETIAVVRGKPRFLEKHSRRITFGASILAIKAPTQTVEFLSRMCSGLLETNCFDGYGKIRFYLWRKPGGLYAPTGSDSRYLLTLEGSDNPSRITSHRVGYSENIRNFHTSYSSFKSMNALKYVLAGIEKRARELQEIILMDHHGHISEVLDANIFVRKGKRYFTPPVTTGCIDGIMRAWLFEKLISTGLTVEERLITPGEILNSGSIFTANSLGIRHIVHLDGLNFAMDERVQEMIEVIS
jgi:branched-subunit amino acid aminotransferase/4-amino-4-deoxychorismate lyase